LGAAWQFFERPVTTASPPVALFSPSDLVGPALFALADALSRAADIAPGVTLTRLFQ